MFSKNTKNNVDLHENSSEKYDYKRGQYLRYAAPSRGSKLRRPELGYCAATVNFKYLFQLSHADTPLLNQDAWGGDRPQPIMDFPQAEKIMQSC